MKSESQWHVRSVPQEVKKKIKNYCLDKGITQARYLATDTRLKKY